MNSLRLLELEKHENVKNSKIGLAGGRAGGIETPPFPLAESGPDSANGKGGVSIGRWQNTALTMSDSPTNRNPPLSIGGIRA